MKTTPLIWGGSIAAAIALLAVGIWAATGDKNDGKGQAKQSNH